MDRLTHNQLDRIEEKLDMLLNVYYEEDKEGNLNRKSESKDKESYARE